MAVWEIKFVHPEWAGGEITTGLPGAQDFFMKSPPLLTILRFRLEKWQKKRHSAAEVPP